MTPHSHWLRNYQPFRTPIKLADHSIVYSAGLGSIVFVPVIEGKQARPVEFTRVLHVPALQSNLLSITFLTKCRGFDVHMNADTMAFSKDGNKLFTATINDFCVAYLNGTTEPCSEGAKLSATVPLDYSL